MNNQLRVVTIGGGTGMPVVNRSLIAAGFDRIKSIVTTFDSGGDTGRMRTDERGNILAYSDYWRSLLSLWVDGEQKELWTEMLRYRDGRSRNFGNTFFQFMTEKVGGLDKVFDYFSTLMDAKMRGVVIPVALTPAEVCFKTKSGREYRGEHQMDDLRMSMDRVESVWLSNPVEANPEAIRAFNDAEIIIICPGSLYGSVLTNFLPNGMKAAYQKSLAKKILITNIMSVANENDGFDQNYYVEEIDKVVGPKSIDLVAMADLNKLDAGLLTKSMEFYRLERSGPIKYSTEGSVKTNLVDIGAIDETNFRVRHSEEKLASYWEKVEI